MSNAPAGVVRLSVREQARAARAAARKLALLSNDARNSVLLDVSKRTEQNAARILAANGEDCKAAGGTGSKRGNCRRLRLRGCA